MSPCGPEVLKTNLTLGPKADGLVRAIVSRQLVDETTKRYPMVSLVILPQLRRQLTAVTNSPDGGVRRREVGLGVVNCSAKV